MIQRAGLLFKPGQGAVVITVLVIIAASLFLQLLPGELRDWLVYDRDRIFAGQYWRLLSGHFLHTNLNHYFMNAGALAVLWILFGRYLTAVSLVRLLFLLTLLTGVGLLMFAESLVRYVGLSGALHGLIIWGAVLDVRDGERTGWLLLLGTAGKILWEQLGGDTSMTASMIDADVAIDAHMFGAISGLVLGALGLVSRPLQRQLPSAPETRA